MAKFTNVTQQTITVIVNGRKIPVMPGQEIEGPSHLSIHTGLKISDASTNKKLVNPKHLENNRNLAIKQLKEKHKPKNVKIVAVDKQNIDIINKPINLKSDLKDTFTFNLKNTISKTRNFIEHYFNNGLPEISICILSKDSYDLIKECVESINIKVKYKNTKIIVFDTGTTDKNVLALYEKWKTKLKFSFEVINVGKYQFSENYNNGIKQINSEFILIQNNDTVALNDYVSKLMKISVLEKVGITGPRMLYKDMRIQHDGQIIYDHQNKKFINPGHLHLGLNENQAPTGRKKVDGITGAGLLIRKKIFEEVGGFNSNYKDIYQDIELNIEARMFGYTTICDLDAKIHHYDNTSRKKEWNNQEKVQQMWKDSNYLANKILKGELFYVPRKKFKFSIVTLVNKIEQYKNLLDDLEKQENYSSFELIAIPNFNGEFSGCSEPLNIGLDLADSDYTILCHQDLRLNPDWLENIEKRIGELESQNWGVLGMAGAIFNDHKNTGATYLNNKVDETSTNADVSYRQFNNSLEVQCLDELCLIVKTNNKVRFDEKTFKGFHLYGSDFCLQYLSAGFKNYAINAPCIHLSDGFSNLKKPEHKKSYLEDTLKLSVKWKSKFKKFRNMTAAYDFNNNKAFLYIAEPLIKQGFKWDKIIDV